MKRLVPLLLAASLCLSQQSSAFWQSRDANYNGTFTAGGGGGGCSQATAFLARTSGLSGAETTATTDLICGLVTDGVITGNMGTTGCGSTIDALYWLATKDTTTANLNLCGTSFGLTSSAAPSFSADNGYTGNGSSQYLNTNYTPSTAGTTCGNGAATCTFGANSATIATFLANDRTSLSGAIVIGSNATTALQVLPYYNSGGGNDNFACVNDSCGLKTVNTGTKGFHIATRTGSTAAKYYLYKTSSPATGTYSAASANAVPSANIYILARNNGGADSFSSDTVAAAFIGSGVDDTKAANIAARVNASLVDLGAAYTGFHY